MMDNLTPAKAAAFLLEWHDAMEDPYAQAVPQAQAAEAAKKAAAMAGSVDAAQRAFIRRWLESVSRDNARLLRALAGE